MQAIFELLAGYNRLGFFKRLFFPINLKRALRTLASLPDDSDKIAHAMLGVYKAYIDTNVISRWFYSCLHTFGQSEGKQQIDALERKGGLNRIDSLAQLESLYTQPDTPPLTPMRISSRIERGKTPSPRFLESDSPSEAIAEMKEDIDTTAPPQEITYSWFEEEGDSYDSKTYSLKLKSELEACKRKLPSALSAEARTILNVLEEYTGYMLAANDAWYMTKLYRIRSAGLAIKNNFGKDKDFIPNVSDENAAEIAMIFARHLIRFEFVTLSSQEKKDMETHDKKNRTVEQQRQRTIERGEHLLQRIKHFLGHPLSLREILSLGPPKQAPQPSEKKKTSYDGKTREATPVESGLFSKSKDPSPTYLDIRKPTRSEARLERRRSFSDACGNISFLRTHT